MAHIITIFGKSGTGKSTSLRNLDPSSTFIFNVASKRLPWGGSKRQYISVTSDKAKGNLFDSDKHEDIVKVINFIGAKRPEIKNVIVDDAGLMMAFEQMNRSLEKGFDK